MSTCRKPYPSDVSDEEWSLVAPYAEPIVDGEGFGAFERPMRFERLVWRALGEGLISPVRGAQLLKRPLSYVEEQIRGPRVM